MPSPLRFEFVLEQKILTKHRPIFSVSKKSKKPLVRNSKPYRDFLDDCQSQLLDQWLPYQHPMIEQQTEFALVLLGKHSTTADADNLSGGVLDALVKARIIKDDTSKYIAPLHSYPQLSSDDPLALISLIIKPITIDDWKHHFSDGLIHQIQKDFNLST